MDDFLTDKHLNKSFKINEIEAEMTKWMEQREKDVHLILESGDAEWMAAYIKTGMLDLSRQMADNHRREIEETKQLMEMIR